jgi:SAM-dependent methyltransferase
VSKAVHIPDAVRRRFASGEPICLELGCGDRKRHPQAIGIDRLAYDAVDIVGDIESTLARLPADSVERVFSHHCFEHLDNLEQIMDHLARIVKPGGRLHVAVPHFSNPHYYSDPTHRQPFGLYTFSYLAKARLFRRRVPTYQQRFAFELDRVKLVFKSSPPFYGRHGVKKLFQIVFNMNRYMMEFYEENLCWMLPCYEIQYDLRRL